MRSSTACSCFRISSRLDSDSFFGGAAFGPAADLLDFAGGWTLAGGGEEGRLRSLLLTLDDPCLTSVEDVACCLMVDDPTL